MAETGEDIVRFTAKELLARMDAKLDSLTAQLIALDKAVQSVYEFRLAQEKINTDQEHRMRSIEKKLWVSAGAALASGGVIGAVGKVLIGG